MFSTRENRCHRFQANIFNKSKCQNCFKTVYSHKLSEADLYQSQTKPVQVGWLLLAPEGTDFNSAGHRKRKWQRRFFVLNEHGLLRYSLDEMPGTLPQGSVNMTQCCEVLDASAQSGFQNCLRLCFYNRDYYIRTENTDSFSISRWQENLDVYPKTAKSNQRKKRKDHSHPQQTEDNQTTSTSSVKRSSSFASSSGSSFNSNIVRRGSFNSSNNSGGRGSSANADPLHNAGTNKGGTISRKGSFSAKGSSATGGTDKGKTSSVVSCTVEGVLSLSEKELEEKSPSGEVGVSSSSCNATSLITALGSSLSSSLDQLPNCSNTGGTKNRLGIESGYSSLEKTSTLVGDAQTYIDSRCDSASVCSSASQHCMFPALKSLSPSPFPPPTNYNSRGVNGGDPEDVVSCSLERKSLESIGERQYETHQTHNSLTHTTRKHALRHGQVCSSGREVHWLFGNQHRSQVTDQRESAFLTLDSELPPSTLTSSSTAQNDHKTTVSTSQDSSSNDDFPDLSRPSTSCSLHSKSLESRALDSTPTPDLLNFKKGWMSRLGEDGKWRKHWFVLTDQTLRFFSDSLAEEAADVDGEINLSTCYDVTDYPVQRNYGFQIHTKDGVFTLCAMTYGIRRNWIQAIMKNVRPIVAPDVTCSIPQKVPLNGAHARAGSSQYNTLPQEEEKRSRIRERRREGRYKTFDWAELSCKHHKEVEPNDLSRREWDHNCEHSVPPAPASSPEELIIQSASEVSEKEYSQKIRLSQEQSLKIMSADIPSHLSLIGVSNLTSPESISPDSLEVDAGTAHVHCDHSAELQKAKPKEKKQVDRATSPLPVTFSSSYSQTEWQWEVELQSLRRELKAERERSQTEERDFKLCEAKLQAQLNNSQDSLHKAELRIQESEALMKERDKVLESLRGKLEEVTSHLKATEEAQALKEVRLQRHLCLLQESQERERRSFSDSLEHSEQRLKELEEDLRQKEAELHKRPTGEITGDLIRRCQELQNQLEESDSEVSCLQARLQTEETLYYDMEHDYEQACEEIQSLRGALQDCERVCEERFQTQLVQQQQELDRKERELQEVLVKMAVLGSSLEETEHRLKEAQTYPPESDTFTEPQSLFKVSNIRQKMKGQNGVEMQPITQGEESERVISVIQALERKLCDTEVRLRELTVHLQQQQQLNTGPLALCDCTQEGRLFSDELHNCTGALHSLQRTNLDRTSDKAEVCLSDNGDIVSQWLGVESPGRWQALDMASRVLSLEALVIQRMASALEQPSTELLHKLSELHVQLLRMAQGGSHSGAVESMNSQIFLYPLEQDQTDSALSESEIQRLCVRAEIAYLKHTLHTHSSQEQQASELFYACPWPDLESSSSSTRKENGSSQGPKLADISPPELAPYSEQMDERVAGLLLEDSEIQLACRQNLVAELHAQAQSLQDLSIQLQSDRGSDLHPELPASILKVAMFQATLAYMACRMRCALQQEMSALRKKGEQAECECRAMCHNMEVLFQEQMESYEEKLRKERIAIEKAEQGRVSADTNARLRVEEAKRMQVEFEEKLQELQKIHEEEMSRLHEYYIQNLSKSKAATPSEQEENREMERVSVTALRDRIGELQTEVTRLREELSNQDDKTFHLDLENIKATYEHGFTIMEESHQRVIEEMQRQHQREVERLTEERERVLQEETNATIAAIEAMRKAHKEEMDKTQKALQNGSSVDNRQLRAQYREELESLHRELEVLSEQYSQKCLENTQLTQTIETERDALSTTQRENQELRTHNQELNECLAAELSLMHSRMNGEVHSQFFQEKDMYQLEVNLRVKESEIKCLKQEINSLKLELQAANTNFKELHSELNALGVKSQSDFIKLKMEPARKQDLKYDLMKSRSSPDFLKDCSTLSQPSLKDGLTVQERMKLFELTCTHKI